MTADSVAITNLLYRYAELMDAGDFAGVAALFGDARIRVADGSDESIDAQAMLGIFEATVKRYPDGTLRTKHVTTNAIVDIDAAGTSAEARSYYTVFQQVDDFPLQPIIAGRYHDRFVKTGGEWRWAERDYRKVDLVGDLSRHLIGGLPT